MTMYRTQSANVLNEADDFGRRLDYQLFLADQEAMLYGDPFGWKPGDPLYPDPRDYFRCDCGLPYCPGTPSSEHPQYYGHHARPMFELFDEPKRIRSPRRCDDCEVGWHGSEDKCWVCGKTVELTKRWGFLPNSFELDVYDFDVEFYTPRSFMTLSAQRAIQADALASAMDSVGRAARGATPSFSLFEDATRRFSLFEDAMRRFSVDEPEIREIDCPEIPEYEPTDYAHLFEDEVPYVRYPWKWIKSNYADIVREIEAPTMTIREVVIPDRFHPDATPINQQRRRR